MSLNDIWNDDEDREKFTVEAEATKPHITSGGSIHEWTDEDKARLHVALEQMKPQEPVAWKGLSDVQWMNIVNHDSCYLNQDKEDAVHLAVKLTEARLKGNNTTPQPCPKCREWENKYLMEQAVNAGDDVLLSENERLKAKCTDLEALITVENQRKQQLEAELLNKEGMTCGDCNDTGWLENRVEGRYPCTCMTEAEPYQILQAKCAELEAEDSAIQLLKDSTITQQAERIAELESEHEKSEEAWETLDMERVQYLNDAGDVLGQNNTDESLINAAKRVLEERDALALQNHKLRVALEGAYDYVEEAIQNYLASYGENFRPHRLQYIRDIKEACDVALDEADLAADIIKRHDAAIRDEMIDLFRLKHRDYANEIAAELEGKS